MGPIAANGTNLTSDYANGDDRTTPSLLDAFRPFAQNLTYEMGVSVQGTNASGIDAAVAAVADAEVVVLTLGTTHDVEHEALDRADTRLPGLQEELALRVLAARWQRPNDRGDAAASRGIDVRTALSGPRRTDVRTARRVAVTPRLRDLSTCER